MSHSSLAWRLPLALAVLSATSFAAEKWVGLIPGAAAGTPAELKIDTAASDQARSIVELKIHGYFEDTVVGPDGKSYLKIRVPGLPQLGIEGGPDLPTARFIIAVATGVGSVKLGKIDELQTVTKTVPLIAPTPIAELDEAYDPKAELGPGDPDGSPEQWVLDPVVYKETKPWPGPVSSSALSVGLLLPAIPTANGELLPFQWTPNTGALKIHVHTKFEFLHPGNVQAFPKITRDRQKQLVNTVLNAELAKAWFPADLQAYSARYLIVTPQAYTDELAEFVAYRKACGFQVTVRTLENIPGADTCANIRAAIQSWYAAGSSSMDHYALLVGDANVIPTCVQDSIPTDDLYGSPSDGDLSEEVYVGRLSVDGADDLTAQLDKILAYEQNTSSSVSWNEAVLVAHKQDAPNKYVGAHESVANASYAVPPSFIKIYGSQASSTNALVTSTVNGGVGLVCYRGHGSTNAWTGWNGTDWHKNQVIALTNSQHPVVWSLSCTNQNIGWIDAASPNQDCIGETWMEGATTGAVAHYGSTVTSGTGQNHELDRRLFEALYDRGLVIHSHAIAWAEQKMNEVVPGTNSWKYLLLGDPAMKVRRNKAQLVFTNLPQEVAVCLPGGCNLSVSVQDKLGNPVPDALVSAFKPGDGSVVLGDDVFSNAYTDKFGVATLKIAPRSLGTVKYTVRGDNGLVEVGSILVTDGPWADLGEALPGANGAPKLTGKGTLVPGTAANIGLSNAAPNAPAFLAISATSVPQPFMGGTLLAFPIAFSTIVSTDASGKFSLPVASWPNSIPQGTKIYFQFAIADAGAPQGVALSNAIRAKQP